MEILETKSKVLTSGSSSDQNKILHDLSSKLATSAQEFIRRGFERSVELASMVGNMSNQDAVRAILRSLKVEIIRVDPISLQAKFEDDLSHLYGGQALPPELSKLIQRIIDSSLENWFMVNEPSKVLKEVLNNDYY